MSDVLLGLAHLVAHTNFALPASGTGNESSSVPAGKKFETYCKDWLSLLRPGDTVDRQTFYDRAFCYQGAANNPPDVMFRGGDSGDAFEFKKTESISSAVVLNSSFPKDVLKATSPGLLDECIKCEVWTNRTFYYVIGHIKKNSDLVNSIWVVDGRLLCATHSIYESLFGSLRSNVGGFVQSNNLKAIKSVELGRLRSIDPLDRTVLRVRSMWELESPTKTFSDVSEISFPSGKSVLHALIVDDRWEMYPQSSREKLIRLIGTPGFTIDHLKTFQSPNNPSQTMSARLIRFER